MKQKDIAIIVVVVIVSAGASFFLSKILFKIPKDRSTKVEVVQPISSNFQQPDQRFFNDKAIDPTQDISIGGSTNPTPFNATSGQ